MNAERQAATDPRTKPSNLDSESTITYTHGSDGQLTKFFLVLLKLIFKQTQLNFSYKLFSK